MKLAKPFFASLGLTAIMAAVSVWALARLPDAPIPVHWALDGRPDGFGPPASVLFILPAVALVLSLSFALVPQIMPPNGDLRRSRAPYGVVWVSVVLLLLALHLILVAKAFGAPLDILRLGAIAVAALMTLLGNYLPKVRYNYVMGIRTPWTLASERVWDRTHRVAGVLMVLAGLCSVVGAMIAPTPALVLAALFVPTLGAAIASAVYSAVISPRIA